MSNKTLDVLGQLLKSSLTKKQLDRFAERLLDIPGNKEFRSDVTHLLLELERRK